MSNTMKKLATVCAIILVAGLAIGGAGYALGGVKGLDKVADEHDWISTSPGERAVAGQAYDSFDSVEVTGNASVYVVSERFYKDQRWLGEMELLSSDEIDKAEVFHVIVIKPEDIPAPEIRVDNNLLKIDAKEKESGISLDFSSGEQRIPQILICCPEKEMYKLSVEVDTGNIMLGGITYKEADLETDTGYVQTDGVIGAKQKMDSDTGDVNLSGVFTNLTKATSDTGDVNLSGEFLGAVEAESDTGNVVLETASFLKAFGEIDLKSDTGDISIQEGGSDIAKIDSTPAHYTRRGPGTKLKAESDTGDIKVRFGHTED